MAFSRFLRSVFAARHNPISVEKRARRRINFELLEDRLTPATFTWIGADADHSWSVAANWSGGVAPADNEVNPTLIFSTATGAFNVTNGFTSTNDRTGITGAIIQITDASPSGDFTIGGNSLTTAAAGITSNVTNGTGAALTFSGITLAAAQPFTSTAGLLDISSPVTNSTFLLTVTGAGNTTISGVIGSGSGGLTKTGAGVLTLSGENTYTGVTTIGGGTISVGSIGSVGSASSNLGAPATIANGTINIGAITTAGTLLYTGGGETTDRVINLSGTTGGATIDQSGTGLLKFTSNFTAVGVGGKTLTVQGSTAGTGELGGAIVNSTGNATAVTKVGSGLWTLSGATSSYTGATRVNGGTLTVTGGSAIPDASAVIMADTASAILNLSANETIASLTGGGAAGGNITLGANTLTVGDTTSPAAYAGIISGSGGLTKIGTGTLTLSGASTYTGVTAINAGSISVASIGSVGSASSNLGAPADAANGTISIGATTVTGTLIYTGSGETTDRVINLAGTTGGATISQSGAGLLEFTSNFTATGVGAKILTLTGSTAGTGEISGIIVDSSSGATGVTKIGTGLWTLSGASTYTGVSTVGNGSLSVDTIGSVGSASSNLGAPTTVAGGTVNLGATTTAGTLIYTGSGETTNRVINLAGTTGGATIDQSGAGLLKFTSSLTAVGLGVKTLTLQGSTAGTGEFGGSIINSFNPNNGVVTATSLTKNGTGAWTLSGVSSYSGATTINEGSLTATGGNAIPNVSAVSLADTVGAVLNITNSETIGSLTGGGTSGGNITLNANTLSFGANNTSPPAYAGVISGNGGITKVGTGTHVLSGPSTYSGPTTVSIGMLQFANPLALYSNTPADWTAANIIVAQGATLALNVGGVGEFTAADVDTIAALGTATTGFASGSTLALDTTAGDFVTSATPISDTNGGANIRNVIKLGANNLTLGAAQTYTGSTTIAGGTLTTATTIAVSAGAFLAGANGATLAASASIAAGGILSPGTAAAATASLNITGSLTIAGQYFAEVNTATAGSGYDQVVVGGAVSLAGTSSLVLSGTIAAAGDIVLIVNNSGSATPVGEFAELAQDDKIWLNGRLYSISYTYNAAGSDGLANDVALINIATTDYFWDPNGDASGLGGAGTWQNTTDAFWTTSNTGTASGTYVTWEVANAAGTARAVFSGTAGTVTVNANVTASSLQFLTTGYILNGDLSFGATPGTVDSAVTTTTINANLSGTFTGSAGLTKLAAGAVILGGANNYTGGTAVIGGVLQIANDGNLGAVPGAATPGNIILNGGTLTAAGTFTLNSNRGIALGQPSAAGTGTIVVNNTFTLTYGGTIANNGAGAGNMVYRIGTNAAAFLNLTGPSTYTGTTTINGWVEAGPMTISNPDALGSTIGGTTLTSNQGRLRLQGGITVADALTMSTTNAAPSLESLSGTNTWAGDITVASTTGASFNTANTVGANLNITGNITLTAASGTISFNPGNTSSSTLTVTGVISGPANVSSGSSSSTSTVVLSALNTYTGQTSTGNAVYSFNSIKNVGGGPSALGAPTTIANGTINVAAGNEKGTLRYTGTGDTTDRVINMAGTNNYGTIIEQAGTGLLKFTSNLAVAANTNTASTKPLTLRGSTAGTGEFAGVISNGLNIPGGVSVTKTGTGTWTLSGNNTYTGPLVVNGGTLILSGNNTSTGSMTLTSGTLTLSGSNTPSGITLNGGTLNINHASALGVGTLNINTNTNILNNTSGAAIVNSNNNPQTWGSSFTFTGSNALDLGTGAVNHGGNVKTVTVNGSVLTVGGVVSGTNTLTKAGPGTLVLSGANDRTGALTVTGGTLVLSGSNLATSGVTNVTGTLMVTNPAALYAADDTKWISSNIIINTGSTLALTVNDATGFSAAQAGTLLTNLTTINNNGLRSGTTVVFDTTGSSGAVVFSTPLTNSTGLGSGAISFTKTGTGTLELSGTNTYTGATAVNAGTLLVSGVLADGPAVVDVAVASGATFGGVGGVINGAVSIAAGATLAPGAAAIGTLNIINDLTLTGVSSFDVTGGSGENGASDKVLGINALGYGGVLRISNVGDDFEAGDSWDLFNSTSRFGTFENVFPTTGDGINLPTLTGGLVWQFNHLDGVLSIVATLQAPTVTGITPVIGPTTGGTMVTITGSNFISISSVTFAGSSPITTFIVTGTTQIDVVTPSHAAGAVEVTVTNSAGSGSLDGTDDFTFLAPLAVQSIAVNGGPGVVLGGTTWSLAGQHSVVKQIVVTFNQAVTVENDAFTVESVPVNPAGGPGFVVVNGGALPSSLEVTATVAATLSPSSFLVTFSGPGTHHGGIINSGVYDLTTIAAKVTGVGEPMVADQSNTFFALFGNVEANNQYAGSTFTTPIPPGYSSGDGATTVFVDPGSLFQFSDTFGSNATAPVGPPAYNIVFDYNLDGAIDPGDLFAFSDAFGIDWDF